MPPFPPPELAVIAGDILPLAVLAGPLCAAIRCRGGVPGGELRLDDARLDGRLPPPPRPPPPRRPCCERRDPGNPGMSQVSSLLPDELRPMFVALPLVLRSKAYAAPPLPPPPPPPVQSVSRLLAKLAPPMLLTSVPSLSPSLKSWVRVIEFIGGKIASRSRNISALRFSPSPAVEAALPPTAAPLTAPARWLLRRASLAAAVILPPDRSVPALPMLAAMACAS